MQNKQCKYYPCHALSDMHCDYCYCPIYSVCTRSKKLDNGWRDCSTCIIVHTKEFVEASQDCVGQLKKDFDQLIGSD